MFRLDREGGRLWRADGELFDPGRGVWAPSSERPGGEAISLLDAAAWRTALVTAPRPASRPSPGSSSICRPTADGDA